MILSIATTFLLSISSIIVCKNDIQRIIPFVEQHPEVLLFDKNECSYSSTYDGEDKSWFALENADGQYHFPHSDNGVSTIKYFISDTSRHDSSLTWNYNMPNNTLGEEVKQNFLNSILKWNNIYFYEVSSNQFVTKKKLVNIVQGTASDYNLAIYPEKTAYMAYSTSAAETGPFGSPSLVVIQNSVLHRHYDYWRISLNLESYGINTTNNNYYLNRYGAHEFGHVLGLKDIDTVEGCGSHHSELLMGYAYPTQSEITYKDLIGAVINSGIHTDLDHQWILRSYADNEYKLICSICNGVKYVNSLDNIDYVSYKYCDDEHELEDGNMFAVASYGNSDYYKCKYCQYVAPFTAIEDQDYDYEEYNNDQHLVTNQVEGLEYSFYEDHSFDAVHTCTLCGYQRPHDYTHHYENYSFTLHKAYCDCGAYTLAPHVANVMNSYIYNGHTYAPCYFCNAIIDLGGNGPIVPGQGFTGLMVTDNGSYILPNGIYVIVEEDLEAYLNGTLVFHLYGEIGA